MKNKDKNQLFELCVKREVDGYGHHCISCKRGLWSVSGADQRFVENEARNYWLQYFLDGEYNELFTEEILQS